MIRKGENNSFVEIAMYEENNENSIDGNIIVSREINLSGRNICKINGRMVTVNELKEFMESFIEIHGQNDNQNLLDVKEHQKYLDNYIGSNLKELKIKYQEYYEKYNNIKKALKENFGDDKERQRKIDLLNYQLHEIEIANLKEGEEEELEAKQNLIANSEKIAKTLNEVDMSLSENAIDIISSSIRSLEKIEDIDEKYKTTTDSLKSVYYELQEIARDMSSYKEDIYFDEEEQKQIDERLDLIYSLKRKYGNSIIEILNYGKEVKEELDKIANLEEYTNKLKIELNQVEKEMTNIAKQMHNLREKYSLELSEKINKNLKDLEMKHAKINVKVEYIENEYFETGKDRITFFVCTNIGEDEKELIKIASGGEMSRIMLAIKTVLADTDNMPVLVFDEIDTGISGKAANSVAEKLNKISKKHQILCISHLPNIAATADYNYYISKQVIDERTLTDIKVLNEEETIKEIARISSGEINEITIKYASELRCKRLAS